jgi:hypothetical protein
VILELLEATGRLQELGALAFVAYSVFRELRWEPVESAGAWRAPVVIGAIGLVSLLNTGLLPPTPIDLLLLVAGVVVAAGSGAIAGAITRLRPLSDANRRRLEERRRRGRRGVDGPLPHLEGRTGWAGAILWLVALGARWGIEWIGEEQHAAIASSVGLALLVVALSDAGRSAVLAWRGRRAAGQPATGEELPDGR